MATIADPMPLRRAGKSGLYLSAMGIGAGAWGDWGDGRPIRVDKDAGFAILDRALELGITHWDTASGYSNGGSERIIGEYFAARGKDVRDGIVLSTKWHGAHGTGRGFIRKAVDGCLRRLQTDYIDIFMLHNPCMDERGAYLAPIDETWGALDDLVSAGKVHYLGLSNAHAINVRDAASALERVAKDPSRRLTLIENHYNVIRRGQVGRGLWTDWVRGASEAAFMSELDSLGIGLIPYWALGDGALTGKYRKHTLDVNTAKRTANPIFGSQFLEGPTLDVIEELAVYAERLDITLAELSIAWLLANKHVASVLAGITRIEQIEDIKRAATVKLTDEQLAQIDDIASRAEDTDSFIKRYFP